MKRLFSTEKNILHNHISTVKIGLKTLDTLNTKLLTQHENEEHFLSLLSNEQTDIIEIQNESKQLLLQLNANEQDIQFNSIQLVEKGYEQIVYNYHRIHEIYDSRSNDNKLHFLFTSSIQIKASKIFHDYIHWKKNKNIFLAEKNKLTLIDNAPEDSNDSVIKTTHH